MPRFNYSILIAECYIHNIKPPERAKVALPYLNSMSRSIHINIVRNFTRDTEFLRQEARCPLRTGMRKDANVRVTRPSVEFPSFYGACVLNWVRLAERPLKVPHMLHPRFAAILYGFGLILMASTLFAASAQDKEPCAALRKDLNTKRQQLSQHVDALKKLNDQGDYMVMAVFSDKIRELIDEVQRIDASLRDCPPVESSPQPEGLEPVKSDPAEYATKSCDELRTLLLQLVQKTTALKRREGSLFSALTPAERTELEEAERAFKELKSAIRSRCAAHEPSNPFRRRRR